MRVKLQSTRRISFSPQPGLRNRKPVFWTVHVNSAHLTSLAQMFLAIRALEESRELSALLITAAEMTPTPIQETAGGVRCWRINQ